MTEPRASSEAAHVASVLMAAQRSMHDPDADLTLMLGELESAHTAAQGEQPAPSDRSGYDEILHRLLTALAHDARQD